MLDKPNKPEMQNDRDGLDPVVQSNDRSYNDIGRLYGLCGKEKMKKETVDELHDRSARSMKEYKENMQAITEEVKKLAGTFKNVNEEGIKQLKELQLNANIALQQYVTATEILTKAKLNDTDRTKALEEVRKASLEIVNSMQASITHSLKTINNLNERMNTLDIIAQAANKSEEFLTMKLKAETDAFALEQGYREGDSIRLSLNPPPPPPGPNGQPPLIDPS